MKPVETIIHHENETLRNLINEHTSIEQLVFKWLEQDHDNSFNLGNGLDDSEQFKMICLSIIGTVEEAVETIAELYYDRDQVQSAFNKYPLFQSFVTLKAETEKFKSPFIIDNKSVRKFEQSVGFNFNDILYNDLADVKEMLPFSMAYALSTGGGVMISRTSPNFLNEFEIEEEDESNDEIMKVDHKNLFLCTAYLMHGNFSTNSSYYFIKRST